MKRFLQLLACVLLALCVVALALAWLMHVFDTREEDAIQVVPLTQASVQPFELLNKLLPYSPPPLRCLPFYRNINP